MKDFQKKNCTNLKRSLLYLFITVMLFSTQFLISFATEVEGLEKRTLTIEEQRAARLGEPNQSRASKEYYDDDEYYDDYYDYDKNDNIQITNMSTLTKEDLVKAIMESDVEILDVRYTGTNVSAGTFVANDSSVIGFEQGVVLSSGSINYIPGPNSDSGITEDNQLEGDQQLEKLIPGYDTYDATILEFDFKPANNMLTFEYVFSSDEYNEYVGSNYNDVFGFFVNGKNVALIPDTSTPVSINNVNNGCDYYYDEYYDEYYGTPPTNSQYYRDNEDGIIDIEMDGLTTVLTAVAPVNPGEKNTIKLAIADAGDSVLDSNIFIKAGSFSTEDSSEITFNMYNYYCTEGDGAAKVTVTRSGTLNSIVSANYTLTDGSAVANDDYQDISGTITFPSGSSSQTINIPIIDDSLEEALETFNIYLSEPSTNAFIGSTQKTKVIILDDDITIEDDDEEQNETVMWDEMVDVASEKNFRIDFSTQIDSTTVTSDNFYVTDEDSNVVTAVTPELTYDSLSVIMLTNGYTYESGSTYYLHISANVKSQSGQQLKNEIIMPFTIKDLY